MAPIAYRRHRFPPVVIQHAVRLYLRFTLSYRDAEELLAERGLDISYESVRSWVLKFGPAIARGLRRCRPRPSDRWHLDAPRSKSRPDAHDRSDRCTRLLIESSRELIGVTDRRVEARGVEAHVIHPSSVAVSREHRRAKTDRLDTELLKRGFLGWLRGERGHCSMARVPTIAEEDVKRPNRERECLVGERESGKQ
jgi:hypothetical protein